MNKEKHNNIAAAWIALHQSKEGSDQYKSNFWAYESLSDLCDDEPEHCLNVICTILNQTDDDLVLANLAAGPLEDLLAKHGTMVVNQIKHEAKNSMKFRKILGAVWRNEISGPIWDEIKAIAGPSW